MKIFLLLTFIPATIVCFAQYEKLPDNENQVIQKEVRQMLNDYYADIKQNGLLAEFKYLDSSPEFFWAAPGFTSSLSYDSVVAVIKTNAKLFTEVDNRWDTLNIYPLTQNLSTYTGRINVSTTEKSGKTNKLLLIETGVVIKRNDGWKLLHGQTSVIHQ